MKICTWSTACVASLAASIVAAAATSCAGGTVSEKIGSTASAATLVPPVLSTAAHVVTQRFDSIPSCSILPVSPILGAPLTPSDSLSLPLVAFEGADRNSDCAVPDPIFASDDCGAIGPDNYVQSVNWAISIFDRKGNLVAGPVNNLFNQGTPQICPNVWSDVVVSYDRYAKRWVISRGGQGIECIAISKNGDPTGSYDLYSFPVSSQPCNGNLAFNDFQKIGVWQDGYYMTSNDKCGPQWTTNIVSVFERDQMLLGAANPRAVSFSVPIPTLPDGGLSQVNRWTPSFADGPTLPPPGTPNFVIAAQDDEFNLPADRVQVNEVHVDWTNPAASTLTATTSLAPTHLV